MLNTCSCRLVLQSTSLRHTSTLQPRFDVHSPSALPPSQCISIPFFCPSPPSLSTHPHLHQIDDETSAYATCHLHSSPTPLSSYQPSAAVTSHVCVVCSCCQCLQLQGYTQKCFCSTGIPISFSPLPTLRLGIAVLMPFWCEYDGL
ncbi:hypothetical protein K439DRAFT_333439 [Ramaria rubella]|nr:hypothetical protein K439DRAFT_333439 [Ramaria rubella]